MLTASPITRQTVGKTFTIAISTLGVGAVMQLGIISWAFATKTTPLPSIQTTDQGLIARLATPAPAGTSKLELNGDIFASSTPEPSTHVTTASPTADGTSKPIPVSQQTPVPEPVNRYEETVQQGKQLRQRGDTGQAIVKFREAAAMDPKNPVPYAELATTYEMMGNAGGAAEHAAENWKKILDMGPNVGGVWYTLAETKLQVARSTALRGVPTAAAGAEEGAPDPSQEINGIKAGAMLGLGQIRVQDEPEEGAAKRFTLHLPIKARPKLKVEVRDLVIHVLFYDIVDGQNVVQTSANVNSRWMSQPPDWLKSDTEELAVEYQLPKSDSRGVKRENRKYYGYIVRIYYKQQLQDSAAEPVRLALQYPPPPTLPKDADK